MCSLFGYICFFFVVVVWCWWGSHFQTALPFWIRRLMREMCMCVGYLLNDFVFAFFISLSNGFNLHTTNKPHFGVDIFLHSVGSAVTTHAIPSLPIVSFNRKKKISLKIFDVYRVYSIPSFFFFFPGFCLMYGFFCNSINNSPHWRCYISNWVVYL